eukprot:TRINITY_DN19667_c0_g1_i1.p1 TRINITY_DN19667_c0_g1~~TRINITY_DN19667_c0_g1_i1.p1  ORF type:complete len:673 (+),score=115.39 TRINITY_DN19667_c0_g1_i1:57-2021(+)
MAVGLASMADMHDKGYCVAHQKKRSSDCLVLTGAGYVCAPGHECKIGGGCGGCGGCSSSVSEQKEPVVCKFWVQGNCNKGDDCAFAHPEGGGAAREPWGCGEGVAAPWGCMQPWACMPPWGFGAPWGAVGGSPWGVGASPWGPWGGKVGGNTWFGPGGDAKGAGKMMAMMMKGKGAMGQGMGCMGGMGGMMMKGKAMGKSMGDMMMMMQMMKAKGKGGMKGMGKMDAEFTEEWGDDVPIADSPKGSGRQENESKKGGGGAVGSIGPSAPSYNRTVCSVHGKLRTALSLKDNGNGTMVCRPGYECKGVSQGQARKSCRLYADGLCLKGDSCTFAHDDDELGEAAREDNLEMALQEADQEFEAALGRLSKAHGEVPNGKVDDDVDRGEGDVADFVWGGDGAETQYEWGDDAETPVRTPPAPRPSMGAKAVPRPTQGSASNNKGKGGALASDDVQEFCSVHNKMRSFNCLVEVGEGNFACRPGKTCNVAGPTGLKRALCKFFLNSSCSRGESCTYAHGEEELGTPIERSDPAPSSNVLGAADSAGWDTQQSPQNEEIVVCARHGKRRKISCLEDSGDGVYTCGPGNLCKAGVPPTKKIRCKFFASGTCDRGEACTFIHDEFADTESVPSRPTGQWVMPTKSATATPIGAVTPRSARR